MDPSNHTITSGPIWLVSSLSLLKPCSSDLETPLASDSYFADLPQLLLLFSDPSPTILHPFFPITYYDAEFNILCFQTQVEEFSFSNYVISVGIKVIFFLLFLSHELMINLSNHIQFSSAAQSCPTLCDPMDCNMPGFSVHQLPEHAQTHVLCVCDVIQPSYPLSSPSPPAFNLSQHQGLFQ